MCSIYIIPPCEVGWRGGVSVCACVRCVNAQSSAGCSCEYVHMHSHMGLRRVRAESAAHETCVHGEQERWGTQVERETWRETSGPRDADEQGERESERCRVSAIGRGPPLQAADHVRVV